jgi:hypothetical protein
MAASEEAAIVGAGDCWADPDESLLRAALDRPRRIEV